MGCPVASPWGEEKPLLLRTRKEPVVARERLPIPRCVQRSRSEKVPPGENAPLLQVEEGELSARVFSSVEEGSVNCWQSPIPVKEEDRNREFSLSKLGGLAELRAVVAREHPSSMPLDSRERFLKPFLRALPQEDREGA